VVKLIAMTQGAGDLFARQTQDVIGYVARVSNPSNQANFDTAPKLLAYCLKHQHWSVFEHASITMEITTSRAIAAQILRHRSFTFQELSQRYTSVDEYVEYKARRQDEKNRQNSIDDLPPEATTLFQKAQADVWMTAFSYYEQMLQMGVAKECARMILPLNTKSTIYMTGNIRSWITYCLLRMDPSTQKEHRDIAAECWKIVRSKLPDIGKAAEEVYPILGNA
jgi:thymidylate synthase (FAD)